MSKSALAPIYLSIIWTMIMSYQLFTNAAVTTVVTTINGIWPSDLSVWLLTRAETIIFIYSFAWIFLLSSAIPSVILGKKRSISIQFLFCLALSLGSIWIKDLFPLVTGIPIVDQIYSLVSLLTNPMIAGIFLLIPFVSMISLDLHSRRMQKVREEL
jgi:hypothetical protein